MSEEPSVGPGDSGASDFPPDKRVDSGPRRTVRGIFETVRDHLLRQLRRSADHDAGRYRGPEGLKCAVGCLITDEAYDPNIEGPSVMSLRPTQEGWVPVYTSSSRSQALAQALNASGVPATPPVHWLLQKLQTVHDSWESSSWRSELARVGDWLEERGWD